jgi:hypothetical protein
VSGVARAQFFSKSSLASATEVASRKSTACSKLFEKLFTVQLALPTMYTAESNNQALECWLEKLAAPGFQVRIAAPHSIRSRTRKCWLTLEGPCIWLWSRMNRTSIMDPSSFE